MNILMIIDTLGIGGAEVSLKTLASGLSEMGCHVVILVIKDDVTIKMDDNIEVEVLNYKKYKFLPSLWINSIKLKNYIGALEKEYGAFGLKVANLTLSHKLAKKSKLKDIYLCVHENVVSSNLVNRKGLSRYFRKRRICRIFNNENVITVSDGIRKSMESIPGLKCKTIQTIFNPIDVKTIKKLSEESNPYKGLEYIVHVGRTAAEKRLDLLLDAYARAKLDYSLVLVGDGPDRKRITDRVDALDLNEKVILAGFVSNPYPIIRDAKLLVLSSDYEGFGVVLAEALCLNTAIVSTDCESGPAEIMRFDLSNYLVPTGNDIELARMMKKAITDVSNNKYPVEQGNVDRFSPELIAKQYIDLAKDL